MELDRKNKLMILFLSNENPLWGRIRSLQGKLRGGAGIKDIQHMADISHAALPSWRNGQAISVQKSERIFKHTLLEISQAHHATPAQQAELAAIVDRFREAYDNPDTRVYDVARELSMDISQCQKIIDQVIYDRWPLFPGLFYERHGRSQQDAQNILQEIGGVYCAWMRRGPLWLQCPMRVRYLLPLAQGSVIRCKMNVPLVKPRSHKFDNRPGPSHPRWEYDGFLAPQHLRSFWAFEKRQEARSDYIYFITCAGKWVKHAADTVPGDSGSIQLWAGSYLTVDQDDSQSIARDDLLLQRFIPHPEDQHDGLTRKFMWEEGKVLAEEQTLRVQRLWDLYHAS